jgi:broad-specificity NMP kinase
VKKQNKIKMLIVITGSPTTGKTTIANLLAYYIQNSLNKVTFHIEVDIKYFIFKCEIALTSASI